MFPSGINAASSSSSTVVLAQTFARAHASFQLENSYVKPTWCEIPVYPGRSATHSVLCSLTISGNSLRSMCVEQSTPKTAAALVKVEFLCNNIVLQISRPHYLSAFLSAVSLPVVTFSQMKSNRGRFRSTIFLAKSRKLNHPVGYASLCLRQPRGKIHNFLVVSFRQVERVT